MPNRPRPTPRNMRLIGEGQQAMEQRRVETPPKPPAAPTWLTAEAAKHWDAIVKEMVAERIWRASFTSTLGNHCALLAIFLQNPEVFFPT